MEQNILKDTNLLQTDLDHKENICRTGTGGFEVRLKYVIFEVSGLFAEIKGEAKHSTILTSTGL